MTRSPNLSFIVSLINYNFFRYLSTAIIINIGIIIIVAAVAAAAAAVCKACTVSSHN